MKDLELENISEEDLAKALGEEMENDKNEESEENESIEEIKEPEVKNENTKTEIHSKTLGSILNINWEELKKAKAKVTITIDFGD